MGCLNGELCCLRCLKRMVIGVFVRGKVIYVIRCNQFCSLSKNYFVMGNLLYIIAVILIIGWLLGMFAFNAGGFIHALLVIAVILFLIKLLGGRSSI
jgi:hypothetical protein